MDIQVETLEKYLQTMGTTQTDLSQFTDKLQSHVNVLPEMRAEFTEKYEKTTEFYDEITKSTKGLQSQISSMRFILENLSRNYDEDRDRLSLINEETRNSLERSDRLEYETDLYERRDRGRLRDKSAWFKCCGGDSDRGIERDITQDRGNNDRLRSHDYGNYERSKRPMRKKKLRILTRLFIDIRND